MSKGGEQFWRATLFSLLGPLLWALHFGAVYGGQHVACAPPVSLSPALIRIAIVVATLAAAAPLLAGAVAPQRVMNVFSLTGYEDATRRFLAGTMRILCLLSLFGVVWAGSAALLLGACPALR
jgi:hypothetical protein